MRGNNLANVALESRERGFALGATALIIGGQRSCWILAEHRICGFADECILRRAADFTAKSGAPAADSSTILWSRFPSSAARSCSSTEGLHESHDPYCYPRKQWRAAHQGLRKTRLRAEDAHADWHRRLQHGLESSWHARVSRADWPDAGRQRRCPLRDARSVRDA